MSGDAIKTVGTVALEMARESGSRGGERLLTLVIGSYNHKRYLDELFAGLERCTSLDQLALIFIDDGSSDGSLAYAAARSFDSRLHVRVLGKRNAGLRDSLASGLALTETPFVAFMASDDRYEPGGLDCAVARLATAPSRDLCWICQAIYMEGRDGEAVYGRETGELLAAEPRERLRRLSVSFPKPLLLQSTLFGTAMLRRAGAWSDAIVLDDWPTFVRVASLATETPVDIAFLPDLTLCRYRLHEGGAHNNLERQLALCLQVADELVDPEHRRESKARIYMDVGLIHLFERRVRRAGALFARGLSTFPRASIAGIVPGRIGRSIARRVRLQVR